MIIVGSTAIFNRSLHIKFRRPNDTDVWVESEEEREKLRKEKGFDSECMPKHIIDMIDVDMHGHASANCVYTIKCSHLGWSNPAWNKHKLDVINLKSQGCELNTELYSELVKHWGVKFKDKKHLSLGQSKEDFFTDSVTYVHDHDWLHELVAYPNPPMYTNCLKDGEQVLVDKEKFNKMPLVDRVRMFREEVTVIAIERFIVNPVLKKRFTWVQAYRMALMKTMNTLTKNWATNFMVFNLEAMNALDYSYFEHALKTLKEDRRVIMIENYTESPIYKAACEIMNIRGEDEMNNSVMHLFDGLYDDGVITEETEQEISKVRIKYGVERRHMHHDGEDIVAVIEVGGKFYRGSWIETSRGGVFHYNLLNTIEEVVPKQVTRTEYVKVGS